MKLDILSKTIFHDLFYINRLQITRGWCNWSSIIIIWTKELSTWFFQGSNFFLLFLHSFHLWVAVFRLNFDFRIYFIVSSLKDFVYINHCIVLTRVNGIRLGICDWRHHKLGQKFIFLFMTWWFVTHEIAWTNPGFIVFHWIGLSACACEICWVLLYCFMEEWIVLFKIHRLLYRE